MTHRHRLLAAVLAAAVAAPGLAGAQPAAPTPAPAPVDPAVQARAKALYEEGDRHYNVAEYPQAIEKFKAAFKLVPDPLFLYNIAQAYRQQGDCASARTFYKNYLRAAPTAGNRARVEQRIAEMDACAPARPAADAEPVPTDDPGAASVPEAAPRDAGPAITTTTTTPSSDPAASMPPRLDDAESPGDPGRMLRLGGLGVVGAGVVGLAVGGLFARASAGHASDLEDVCRVECDSGNPDVITAERDGARAERNAIIAFAAGGGLVVAGAALYWWGHRRGQRADEPARTVVIVPSPRGGQVLASWRF